MKNNSFLQQLKRRQHLVAAPGHVDAPSEKTVEQLEHEQKRLEVERIKAEIDYWQDRRQANAAASGGEPVFGLATNQQKHGKRFRLPKRRMPRWK